MRDFANNEIYPGDFVKIIYSDYESHIGKVVKVIKSDNPDKIKVDFNDQWWGYFFPYEVVKYNVLYKKKFKDKNILDDYELVLVVLRHPDHPLYQNLIKLIKKTYKSLNEIFDYLTTISDDISAKEFFEFGSIFSK
jgi:hypothetical protein